MRHTLDFSQWQTRGIKPTHYSAVLAKRIEIMHHTILSVTHPQDFFHMIPLSNDSNLSAVQIDLHQDTLCLGETLGHLNMALDARLV